MTSKPFAFVLMPFSSEFDDIYNLGIQAVASENGVTAERVDEQIFNEGMLDRIYGQIDRADFVIADVTGRNPNVFYEVGYAHGKQKPVTLLTKSVDDIPFDLKHHRHLVYNGSISTLKSKLSREIIWLKAELSKRKSNPFTTTLHSLRGELNKSIWRADAELKLEIDVHNHSDRASPVIEAAYLYTAAGWVLTQDGTVCASTDSTAFEKRRRHFIKCPVARLQQGGWARISLKSAKVLAVKKRQDETPLKNSYPLRGFFVLEFVTSDGSFQQNIDIDIEIEESLI